MLIEDRGLSVAFLMFCISEKKLCKNTRVYKNGMNKRRVLRSYCKFPLIQTLLFSNISIRLDFNSFIGPDFSIIMIIIIIIIIIITTIIIIIMTTYFSISEQLPVHFRRNGNTGVCLFVFFSWEKVCVFFFLLMTKMPSLFQRSSRVLLGQFSVNFLSSKVFL